MRCAEMVVGWLLVGLMAVSTTGCGSKSETATAATPPLVDVATLDVGGYRSIPAQLNRPGPQRARLTEGQRLASYLPLPLEIDSRFVYQDGANPLAAYGFTDNAAGSGLGTDLTGTPGFVAGFNVNGNSDKDDMIATHLAYSVLLFTDGDSARASVAPLVTGTFTRDSEQPANIDGRPDTRAVWDSTDSAFALESFTAVDNFVLYITVSDGAAAQIGAPDQAASSQLTTRTIDAVSTHLRDFHPTPPDQLADQPIDHEGMLGRTLFRFTGEPSRDAPGIYDRHGALLLSADPVGDRDLFAVTGMDWMSVSAGRLYRTRDADAAHTLAARHDITSKFYRHIDSPANLPSATCTEYHGDDIIALRFHCVVAYDRYAAEVWSSQIIDVHQRISAQYTILRKG